jgi:hypothetical protein
MARGPYGACMSPSEKAYWRWWNKCQLMRDIAGFGIASADRKRALRWLRRNDPNFGQASEQSPT